jgi:hypothetical protein
VSWSRSLWEGKEKGKQGLLERIDKKLRNLVGKAWDDVYETQEVQTRNNSAR